MSFGSTSMEMDLLSDGCLTPTQTSFQTTPHATATGNPQTPALVDAMDCSAASHLISSPTTSSYFEEDFLQTSITPTPSTPEPIFGRTSSESSLLYSTNQEQSQVTYEFDHSYSPARDFGVDTEDCKFGYQTPTEGSDEEMENTTIPLPVYIEKPVKGPWRDDTLILSMVTVFAINKQVTAKQAKEAKGFDITVGCMTEATVTNIFKQGATFEELTMRFLDGNKKAIEENMVKWVKFMVSVSPKIKTLRIIYPEYHNLEQIAVYDIGGFLAGSRADGPTTEDKKVAVREKMKKHDSKPMYWVWEVIVKAEQHVIFVAKEKSVLTWSEDVKMEG